MSLDSTAGSKLSRALKSLRAQRPTVDIGGGDIETVGGDGKGLLKALEMYEWELNAETASGPCSPLVGPRNDGSFGEEAPKRKSPLISGSHVILESPGTKKVKAATVQMEEITL
eukprot:TRINITY_DN2928_c0_g1_i2.p3 TRINITY_DN2928_c0_g1~~TRINITY_DN2928_c0_g1_i2.p3  ORF type:complete len:114 (+),score=22.78 TRINITY_DN2928_c0_g1_i2:958-1299(+)